MARNNRSSRRKAVRTSSEARRRPAFKLISKRSSKLLDGGTCANCKKSYPLLWRYAESTIGSLNLCTDCKPLLLDFSFGKMDALDHAVTGGGFEQNRRRH